MQAPEPSAVAATLSASAVAPLEGNPAVAQVIPDPQVQVQPSGSLAHPLQRLQPAGAAGKTLVLPVKPEPGEALQEGEANINFMRPTAPGRAGQGQPIATGTGVVVANEGTNELAGNPNFTRPDGTPVVIDAPSYTADDSNDEFYGDASSIAAQGTVNYQYSGALPLPPDLAGLRVLHQGRRPRRLAGRPVGHRPSIRVQTQARSSGSTTRYAAEHADVISESFGAPYVPGTEAVFYDRRRRGGRGRDRRRLLRRQRRPGTLTRSEDPPVIAAGGTDNFAWWPWTTASALRVQQHGRPVLGRHRADEQARRPGRAVLVRRRSGLRRR